jgi:regulatory protein
LYEGRELDAAGLDEMLGQAAAENVNVDAYQLLGHRARSREELRRRLLQKGHGEVAVGAALGKLAAEGLVDDAEFARLYVADKRGLNGWGAQRIRRGLVQLGVEPAAIDVALRDQAADSEADEIERAVAVLRRKGAPQPPLDHARRRAYELLVRRGYSATVAYAAVRRWAGEGPLRAGDAPSELDDGAG